MGNDVIMYSDSDMHRLMSFISRHTDVSSVTVIVSHYAGRRKDNKNNGSYTLYRL